ncbi:MAG: phosphopantetheine-binding protein [Pseudomonadota bacterium]|jgi:acyl carrier protein
MTSTQGIEDEVKVFIISTLKLDDVTPEAIEADAPLFGAGLGLDSVDALELGVALHKTYGIKIDSKSQESREHLRSVRTLAALIEKQRASAPAT